MTVGDSGPGTDGITPPEDRAFFDIAAAIRDIADGIDDWEPG